MCIYSLSAKKYLGMIALNLTTVVSLGGSWVGAGGGGGNGSTKGKREVVTVP